MNILNPVTALYAQTANEISGNQAPAADKTKAFSDMVRQAVQQTVADQKTAEGMSLAAANGENVPMHQVIQAISKAELSLQTMMTVRDRAVEAYQEILRTPI